MKPCGHIAAADTITDTKKLSLRSPPNAKSGERKLEDANWAKVSDNQWFSGSLGKKPMTQKQIDFIFDWCQINNRKYPPDHVRFIIEDMDRGYF